jgi:predicted phage baseplate assembly protein
MTLPAPELDTRDFQSLVTEARERITRSCPEWTDHNVSDPGITLIELFAWMTEMLVFRINRLPRKVHIALLDLLGIQLDAPTAATTGVRFRLASPATAAVRIEGRQPAPDVVVAQAGAGIARMVTEVATRRTPTEEPVIFEVSDTFVIRPLTLVAYTLHRTGRFDDIGVSTDGQARPQGPEQLPFSTRPVAGDAAYLGFAQPLDRLVVQLDVSAVRAHGVGVNPNTPPLRWEVSQPGGTWARAEVLADGTGGFNYGSGLIELQLPLLSAPATVGGHEHQRYWLRCRVEHDVAQPDYVLPPRITRISCAAVGALVDVWHAATVLQETIGHSDGTASQSFHVRYVPALRLDGDAETLEVREPLSPDWQRWTPCDTFTDSDPHDRHFTFDPSTGEVELGPSIRQDDGSWRQYGAIPGRGATLRLGAYRHGGGQRGNVAANTVSVLRTAIKGVASVTNPQAARGGVDLETIEKAQDRAALELRSTYRAVTTEDFAFFAEENRRVARAICVEHATAVAVHILPVRNVAARPPEPTDLIPPASLIEEVRADLDERRLLGMDVLVQPVETAWVSVAADVLIAFAADAETVRHDVELALYAYLDPWPKGPHRDRGGWQFGRALTEGELYGLVQGVAGVEAVARLLMYRFDHLTQRPEPTPIGPRLELGPAMTVASGPHTIRVRTSA